VRILGVDVDLGVRIFSRRRRTTGVVSITSPNAPLRLTRMLVTMTPARPRVRPSLVCRSI
jgi:hypothetical protein